MKPLITGILLAASLLGAQRRVVIIVRPSPRIEAANAIGYGVASLIQAWIDRKQGRGPGMCDPLFDSGCSLPALRLAPVVTTGPGDVLLPGQCPGLLPCTGGAK